MARPCRRMVEGGGSVAAYPCELFIDDVDTQHPGPCMVKELPVSVTRRLQWARENGQTDEIERISRCARSALSEFQGPGRTAGEAMDGGTEIPPEMNTRIEQRDPDAVSERMTPGASRPTAPAQELAVEAGVVGIVHRFPSDGSMVMPCCGQPMDQIAVEDAVTPSEDRVTCRGVESAPVTTEDMLRALRELFLQAKALGEQIEDVENSRAKFVVDCATFFDTYFFTDVT